MGLRLIRIGICGAFVCIMWENGSKSKEWVGGVITGIPAQMFAFESWNMQLNI